MLQISRINWILLIVIVLSCCTYVSKALLKQSQGQEQHSIIIEKYKVPTLLVVGEGFTNPIGYYESVPRFSWQLPASENRMQLAYQIQVSSGFNKVPAEPLLWDSGKVNSAQNAWIKYQGPTLQSRQQVMWRVRYWDQDGIGSDWSDPQSIELGLLSNNDWQGNWIGHPDTNPARMPSKATLATPQYLRKPFLLKDDVAQARLYVSAKGLFKAFINGSVVAPNDVMTPGWTPYSKRIETLTYDVTSLLSKGQNVLSSVIAGGWYAGRAFDQEEQEHRLPARFLAQLEITLKSGEIQIIKSDDSWFVSQDGPIRFASIYDGEKYDQAKVLSGWNTVNFDINTSSKWVSVLSEPVNDVLALRPKRHAPIRHKQTIPVQAIVSKADSHQKGIAVFDFGQNMVGVPRIKVPAIAGQEITIRFAEALHKGEFYTENYRSAKSTNTILPNQTGEIWYQPTFTYHGYRYIEISGFDSSFLPQSDWVEALVQHSDVALHAGFTSSHDKLNKLSENILWGLRSNFYDIPLDCPQRDERLGWTGDAQVFATPSMYLADVYGFWAAWLQSVREDQSVEGKIPLYVPHVEWKIDWASSGWGDAITIIPWDLYILTGDKQIVQDNYPAMKKWVEYHETHASHYISTMNTFGDWLQPFSQGEGVKGNRGDTDFSYISTAYFARSVELTMKAALVLGNTQEAEYFSALHKKITTAFRKEFLDENLLPKLGKPTQTFYLLGLSFNLFPEDKIKQAQALLIEQVVLADNYLRTGFLGTPMLLTELQKSGRTDLAYHILFNETYPSWFYSINNGATTTWERWNSYSLQDGFNPQGMNSLNHYAYGSVYRWFFEGILGIQATEPGFKTIQIAPQLGEQLDYASGEYLTPQGTVRVAWQKSQGLLSMQITVPSNTTANIVVPQGYLVGATTDLSKLSPGNYSFTFQSVGHM
ncbi:glycoside hydrolase family 78 protein [Rheinheimera sp. UJ51]|uniref:alpha-L-rhamnosidase n=1 Tax=unclassified Rheinheimera TaxID=115860 RepID=UPI001E2DD55A|nr:MULTISPECIES: alpha-L-rhamnosidase [unclassified Rheinheimera]MCC5453270.1 glycoside hydrolase family 78 protein [Rheinheimera sp. UJ51]MCF4010956.1 glycoside hydrolase family 78 protein [Rheinheimera sp. UJ63]